MPQDFLDSEDSNFSTSNSNAKQKQASVKLGGIAAEPANSSPAKRQKSRHGASGLASGTPDERIAMLAPREELNIRAVQPCGALLARKRANGSVLLYWRTTYAGNTIREEVGIYSATANRSWNTPAEDGRYCVVAAVVKASAIALEHVLALPIGGIQGKRRHEQELKQKAIDDAQRALQARESYSVGKLAQLYAAVLIKEGKPSAKEVFNAVERHVMSHPLALEAASDITNEQLAELLRPIYERGNGRQGNKVRSYLHAAFSLAASSRASPETMGPFIPFNVRFNPVAQVKAGQDANRPDKDPLSTEEMRTYWRCIEEVPGPKGAALRLHLLGGAPRIMQFVRARCAELTEEGMLLWDLKGRPGGGPRKHKLPLLLVMEDALVDLPRTGTYLFSSTGGRSHISNTTLSNWAREAVGDKISRFTLKRTRSGVETLLSMLKVDIKHRGYLQSHGISGVQSKHYDANEYLDEKYAALEVLHEALMSDEAPVPTHVQAKRKASQDRAELRRAMAEKSEICAVHSLSRAQVSSENAEVKDNDEIAPKAAKGLRLVINNG